MTCLENAFALGLLLRRRGTLLRIVLVHGVDGHEVAVEQFNHLLIRERTRPHRKGASSAPANIHSSVVREKEHRPMVLRRQAARLTTVFGPADFIEALLFRSWLEFRRAFAH